MIDLKVTKNDVEIMVRTYYDPSLTLQQALSNMEMYIVNERLNEGGECKMSAKFTNLQKSSP